MKTMYSATLSECPRPWVYAASDFRVQNSFCCELSEKTRLCTGKSLGTH